MQKREAKESDSALPDSAPPATPRVSGEVSAELGFAPASATRAGSATDTPASSEPSDTLLSAGKPAERWELVLDDRLVQVDERLHQLDVRLTALEQNKSTVSPLNAPEARPRPWLWLAFLITLVVVFQLLRRLQ